MATHQEDVSPEELAAREAVFMVRTGCRWETGWGLRPHIPFNPDGLTFMAIAIGCYVTLMGDRP
ncbi:MAG: hypothetical protein HC769_18130 [Cyanobacteria bacterium CRU_2_1]|nr:hypothetical protein [Cyanobacteria bacterium CRU_2_1]